MDIKEKIKKYRITLIVLIVILLILACNIMAIIYRGGIYFGRKRWFSKLSFSPDGKTIASRNYTSQVIFWNWKEGKISHKITYKYKHYAAYDFSYSPDGKYFAISGLDGFRLYNTNNYELIYSYKGKCTNLCFYPDGNLIAFIVMKPKIFIIKVLDIEKERFVAEVRLHRVLEDNFNLKFAFTPLFSDDYYDSNSIDDYEPIILSFFVKPSSSCDESHLLNASEILKWNDLLRKLKRHDNEDVKLLYGLLGEKSRNIIITQWDGKSPLDIYEKRQILADLNKIICSRIDSIDYSVSDNDFMYKYLLRKQNRKFIGSVFSGEIAKCFIS